MIYRCGGYVGLPQSSYQVVSKQVMSVNFDHPLRSSGECRDSRNLPLCSMKVTGRRLWQHNDELHPNYRDWIGKELSRVLSNR